MMLALFWLAVIIFTVPLAFTVGVLSGRDRAPKIMWSGGAAALVLIIVLGVVGFSQKPFSGPGKIIDLEYKEAHRRPGAKVSYYVPECYRATIIPSIEPKTLPEHHITSLCLSKPDYDQLTVGETVTITRDKTTKPWGWKTQSNEGQKP